MKTPKNLIIAAVLVSLATIVAGQDSADRVSRLIEIFSQDSSYKVRIQAAVALGKLRDRRAVPALIAGLDDDNYSVRAVAAAALGQIGDPKALDPLKRVATKDVKPLVRSQAKQSIALLERKIAPVGVRYFLTFGKFINSGGLGGPELARSLVAALTHEFSKVPIVTLTWGGGKPTKSDLAKYGMAAYVLDGAIVSITDSPADGQVELTCNIKVSLSTYPQNSIKAFYSGGTSMIVSADEYSASTPKSQKDALYQELISGAAQGAREHIVQHYLRDDS